MNQRAFGALARSDFSSIPRYTSSDDFEVNLADNTNLWGTPPAAAAMLRSSGDASQYPDIYGDDLKNTVAAKAGITPDCVVTGNGSDDLLDCVIRAFAAHGDTLAHPDPTFVMVPVFSRINGVTPVPVPLAPDYSMDADALLATGARIIYLCTPNNPTGTSTSRDAVRKVIANAPGIVIIDEAYAEFTGDPGLLAEAPALGRVLVCRTMSKAYGLAGLRVGYGTGAPEIVANVERSRGPYKMNDFAERAAVAAMTTDAEWVAARVREAIAVRERLATELKALELPALPSATNFLLVPTSRASTIAAHCRSRGIGIRLLPALTGIGSALRITVAPWPVMERLLTAIREIPAE